MKFSDNLRNIRLDRKLTQMKLAEALGTSQSAITSWENNQREPDFRTIQRIADYFGVPLSALLPSSDNEMDNADMIARIMDAAKNNQELCNLYDALRTLKQEDIKAVFAVVRAIKGETGD